jgi:hypothetical protein
MIDTNTLMFNSAISGVPGENLGHRSTLSRVRNDDVVLAIRIDIDVLVSKGIDAHSDNKSCCRNHGNNYRVCGRITEPCLFQVVVVTFLP